MKLKQRSTADSYSSYAVAAADFTSKFLFFFYFLPGITAERISNVKLFFVPFFFPFLVLSAAFCRCCWVGEMLDTDDEDGNYDD